MQGRAVEACSKFANYGVPSGADAAQVVSKCVQEALAETQDPHSLRQVRDCAEKGVERGDGGERMERLLWASHLCKFLTFSRAKSDRKTHKNMHAHAFHFLIFYFSYLHF